MQLQHIDLTELKTTRLNVRKQGEKSIADLVPSIRSLGLIQPLLVRPNCEGYEIIAGQRRYHALNKLAEENAPDPVPCLVMDKGDDAKAIEASLAENIARLPMDEIDQYKAFSALIKQGQSVGEIAVQFGVTERLVTQRLAIANLMTPILNAYRKQDICAATVRLLTMASKAQQKAWVVLFNSEDEHAPEGYHLKSWLLGGAQISTDNALFDLKDYGGAIVADLFGDSSYFDDPDKFWALQDQAIANARDTYLAKGWADAVILDRGEHFPSYDYIDTDKENGGKVYVASSNSGDVTFYEGQLSRKGRKAKDKAVANGEEPAITEKPELTKPMQNYLDLHRHSAVRTELLNHQGIALRVAVAQIICGSSLWTVHADPQKAHSETIGESLKSNKAEDVFLQKRTDVLALLGLTKSDDTTLVRKKEDWNSKHDLHAILSKLIVLPDEQVSQVLTLVVAETLPCGSALVEALGFLMKTDMSEHWKPDSTMVELLRDKQVINAVLKDVAGKSVADARVTSTGKSQKEVINQCLDGARKATKENWQPRYMEFPMKSYTKLGGIQAIEGWKVVKKHYH